jgi:glutamate/tyrosine decarboxylase-like PLP-dependent enzyme
MAMRNAINDNTILLVASAPIYSQGVVDPIPEIGTLALEKNICFHVDACVGGIHLAIMREMGYNVPLFDLTIKGITSISVDLHKYGYAAKGASAILYRDKSLRRYQIYACADTTAYDLINATILSSKTGGPIAGSWAILNYLGMDGYKQIVRAVQDATGKLIDGINRTGDLRILGKPDMCMFSFTSDTIDLFQLADEMRGVGWYLQPQFSTPISPINLHVSVNYGTVDHVEQFLSDLHACVRKVKDLPPTDYSALKSAVASILQNPSPEVIGQIIAMAGLQGSSLPDKMAPIYAVLDTLPKPFANALLVEYFNNLYS